MPSFAATDKTKNPFRMIDRLPMIGHAHDSTLARRLHPYLLPVPASCEITPGRGRPRQSSRCVTLFFGISKMTQRRGPGA